VINRLNGSKLIPILPFLGNGNGDALGWQLPPVKSRLQTRSETKSTPDRLMTVGKCSLILLYRFPPRSRLRLEDHADVKPALRARKEKGAVPLQKVKARLGMK